jgi:hypothetical protein
MVPLKLFRAVWTSASNLRVPFSRNPTQPMPSRFPTTSTSVSPVPWMLRWGAAMSSTSVYGLARPSGIESAIRLVMLVFRLFTHGWVSICSATLLPLVRDSASVRQPAFRKSYA